MAAQGEVGLDPLLEGSQTQLLEASDLALCERLGREVRKRRSSPKGKCGPQRLRCTFGLALGEELSTLPEQALETAEVELLRLEREQVPMPARLQTPVPERLAELRDVDVDAVEGARGRAFLPERVDQAVRGDDLAGAQEKECEQRPLFARAYLERLPALGHLERAEDAEFDRLVTTGQVASLPCVSRPAQAEFKHDSSAPAHVRAGRSGTGGGNEHHEGASMVRRTGAAAVGRDGVESRRGHEPSSRSEQ